MQRTTNTKLISGLSASGSTTTITAGSGINVSKGTVSIDGTVVATDTELSTQLQSKLSATDNNINFSGTTPQFTNNLTVASKVLVGNNSGFGIVCAPNYNSLSSYSLLFDGAHHTLLNKINAGAGEVAIRLHNQSKIAVADLPGEHTNCAIRMTPTSVVDTGMEITGTHVKCNETLEMKIGKDIVVPAESILTIGGTDVKFALDDNNTKIVSHTADITTNTTNISTNTSKLSALTQFQQTWTYSRNVLLTSNINTPNIWSDGSLVWVDSATGLTGVLPDGIYTCKITTLGSDVHGNRASDNNLLKIFTGSFTHIVNGSDGTFDNVVPEIVETVNQWWNSCDLTDVAGSRAVIVRRTSANFPMQTYFRFTNTPFANESNIKFQFIMKRLW